MPLIICPDCNRDISDAALSCPGCGRPMRDSSIVAGERLGDARPPAPRSKSRLPRLIIVLVAAFLIIRFFFGNEISESLMNFSRQSTYNAPERIYTSTAEKLISEYVENEVAADARYRGATIDVSGTTRSIRKGSGGEMYVTMTGQTKFGIRSFQAYFPRSAENDLIRIRKEQRVIIRCKIDGLFINVIGSECSLLM